MHRSVFQVVYGQATSRARWRECEDYVTGQMGMVIGQKFVKQEFDESAKANVSRVLIILFCRNFQWQLTKYPLVTHSLIYVYCYIPFITYFKY